MVLFLTAYFFLKKIDKRNESITKYIEEMLIIAKAIIFKLNFLCMVRFCANQIYYLQTAANAWHFIF